MPPGKPIRGAGDKGVSCRRPKEKGAPELRLNFTVCNEREGLSVDFVPGPGRPCVAHVINLWTSFVLPDAEMS